MHFKRRMYAGAAALFVLASVEVFAKEHGRGHGKEKREAKRESRYSDHDRDVLRAWFNDHRGHLPPGLAKRDELPPGLENQLVAHGTLPPGLRKKIRHCPRELVSILPPPPPDCRHVVIGGNIVLLNLRTYMILDVFRFEM